MKGARVMEQFSVSVVIPAFNAAHTIGRAVDSVLAQSELPQEIVVVDDGSSDDLASALRPYGSQVHLSRIEHGGVSVARNAAIEASTGEIIAFLDADDYWERDKLSRQLEIFRKYPRVGLVASSYFVQRPGTGRVAATALDATVDQIVHSRGALTFRTGCALWTGTVAIRRSVLGEHRFDPTLSTAEDRDLWIRLLEVAPHFILSAPLATHVLEPGSLTRSDLRQDYSNMLKVIDRYKDFLGPEGRLCWESLVFEHWAGRCLAEGNYREAFQAGLERLKREPLNPVAWWVVIKSRLLRASGTSDRQFNHRIGI